jgi:tetratricopeptide (TPR) repeat protein
MAADVAPGLHRAAQAESLRCLELEHDNLRAALEWLAGHDGSRLAGMAMALWPFWQAHGDNSEGRDWLSRALEIAGSGAPPAVRAGLLYGMGFLSWSQGDDAASRHELGAAVRLFEEAGDSHGRSRAQVHLGIALWMAGVPPAECLADLEQAIAVLREFDDTESLADGLHYLGHVVFEQGDLEKARSLWDESSALSRRQGDRWGLALSVKDLGLVAARNGDLATARRLYAESLAILRETHEKWHIADTLNRLGEIAVSEQSLGEARACFEEALALAREVDNQSGVVETINRIAELHLVDGDLAEARRLYEQCLELSTQIANQRLTAAMQHNLGNVALREGQLALAGRHFRDSLYIYAELGRDAGLAMAVDGVAAVAALSGNFEVAARAFGLAAAARERAGAQFDRIEHEIDVSGIVRHVEEQMGEEPFGAALAAGRRMEVASLLGRAIEASEWP